MKEMQGSKQTENMPAMQLKVQDIITLIKVDSWEGGFFQTSVFLSFLVATPSATVAYSDDFLEYRSPIIALGWSKDIL